MASNLPRPARAQPQAQDTYYANIRPEVIDLVPIKARTILDVGCGSGNLGANLKARQAAEVHGVELVAQIATTARSKLDRVWNSTIEDALPELQDGFYECIVLADVLEHVVDPWGVLRRLTSKLAAGGTIVASIPNIQNWDTVSALMEGRWDYRSQGILDRTHLRFFTRKSIEELFWNSGLRVQTMRTSVSGSSPDPSMLRAMTKSGLTPAALAADGRTFQFLVVAHLPARPPAPRVFVVVTHHDLHERADQPPGLLQCVESVRALTHAFHGLIVVDGARGSDAFAQVRQRYPELPLHRLPANLGYAGLANKGIGWALEQGAEYILHIDSSSRVAPEALGNLIDSLAIFPDGAILGTKVLSEEPPHKVLSAGAYWRPGRQAFEQVGRGEADSEAFAHASQVDQLAGSALFFSAQTYQRIGPLDERFFHWSTVIDWCYRAKSEGHKCIIVPDAVTRMNPASAEPVALPSDSYFNCRDQLLWARKHVGLRARGSMPRHALRTLRQIIVPPLTVARHDSAPLKGLVWALVTWLRSIKRNVSDANRRAALLGLRDYYLGRFGDCPAHMRALHSAASVARDRN